MTIDHGQAFVEEAHELLASVNSLLELEETPGRHGPCGQGVSRHAHHQGLGRYVRFRRDCFLHPMKWRPCTIRCGKGRYPSTRN